ncbi:tRNA (adenosine(37)-N6)-threonylcarbamoyltransferase complex dimerization subunit type 1 TsaB [Niabella insulamsoli]|uniref:tRNA (adenosine(37)-N6)-threonylcarbamoyltransferase complex dimerization subunit type 1 TsaB n=1 Tax=Niabella insulamsoli TaxID=3144874 RepID=UPI0031FBECD2
MLLLNIDTAIEKGSFCISDGLDILVFDKNDRQKEQASWLHEAIRAGFDKIGADMRDLDAVAVSSGPGSYTGLRIGMATAKGFCYALTKPLICLSTLEVMARAVHENAKDLICPMIDARRMEVFSAIFTKKLETYKDPFAATLDSGSFAETLAKHQILFTGNGSLKFEQLMEVSPAAQFIRKDIDARDMIYLSLKNFKEKTFADVAYSEPYYVKDVYIANRNTA